MTDLPHLSLTALNASGGPAAQNGQQPKVLLLYGSLREHSRSRMLTIEASRLLHAMGATTRIFDPRGLPFADTAPSDHPKVRELRDLSRWSEAHVWCSPELHGSVTGIMKTQLDWLPLTLGGEQPTASRTLALMQVCGGGQSFNAVNQMRLLGRWMHMFAIPSQISVPKSYDEFDADERMRPSIHYERLVDVMEELLKLTLLLRDHREHLADRYSERKKRADEGTNRNSRRS
jgi:arsenic resistance protein ArsH